MKFTRNLKFVVLLLVILSVFAKRARRTTTANKVATKLEAQAEIKSSCWESGRWTVKNQWLLLDTQSANSQGSGFQVMTYSKNSPFNCRYMQSIGQSNSRNKYFISFRDFSTYDSYSKNNAFYLMRRFMIKMKNNTTYNFLIDKGMFSDDITQKELQTMTTNMNTNRNSYTTRYRNYYSDMIRIKVKAEELRNQKTKNIDNRHKLNSEIDNKKAELLITQETLRDLKLKSEASKLQIRNFESEINLKKVSTLDPAIQSLQESVTNMDALESQVTDNKQKISGVVAIDSNDLTQSLTQLKTKLTGYKGTYMASDPKSVQISTLIANIDTQMDNIPTIVQ